MTEPRDPWNVHDGHFPDDAELDDQPDGEYQVVQRRDATEPGALPAWEMRCTCGTTLATSLSHNAAYRLLDEHRAYHAKVGA